MGFTFGFEIEKTEPSTKEESNAPLGISQSARRPCEHLTPVNDHGEKVGSPIRPSLTFHQITALSYQLNDSDSNAVHLSHTSSFNELSKSFTKPLRRIITTKHSPFNTEQGLNSETDLIPGVYEGGLKIWECSIDLCQYLSSQCEAMRDGKPNDINGALSDGGSTLELGCGQALPACFILREIIARRNNELFAGAGIKDPHVWFTDYNGFVLRDVTLPNIWLNVTNEQNSMCNESDQSVIWKDLVTLISGDWSSLSSSLSAKTLDQSCKPAEDNEVDCINLDRQAPKDGRFDLLLASETTYTTKAAQDTASWMIQHLKLESGVGLVAMKRYYFGVGGGSDSFRHFAGQETIFINHAKYGLEVKLVEEYKDGISNIRDLWRVRCVPI
jgi:hypothetical protein